MNQRTYGKRHGGFTLVETLLVTAILMVLLGFSLVGVAYYRDYLKITELDNEAREIYMAAENRAVLLQGSGASASLLSSADPAGVYELSNGAAEAEVLLPAGSIDPALRNGDFRVLYDRETGHVTEVFYAEGEIGSDLELFRKDRSGRVADYRAGGSSRLVGWYSGGTAAGIDTRPLPTPGVEVFIENGEELRLTVVFTLPEDLPAGADIRTPNVKLKYGDREGIELFPAERLLDLASAAPGTSLTYEWVLDSLESGKQFKNLVSGELGGDFTVTAKLTLGDSGGKYIGSAYYAQGTDNSLFAEGSGAAAYIANLRHLQNLHPGHSGVGSSVTGAEQLYDVDCKGAEDEPEPYNFIPIENKFLTSYDGGGKDIENLYVERPGNAGLFGKVEEGMSIGSLRLVSPRVTNTYGGMGENSGLNAGCLVARVASGKCELTDVEAVNASAVGYTYAGGLVGTVNQGGECSILRCRVYWTDPGELTKGSSIAYKIRSTKNDPVKFEESCAGGLIGYAKGPAVIEESFAATTVWGRGGAGGLVGRTEAPVSVERSYADCYLKAGTFCGGLIGRTQGAALLSDCYAAGFVRAASAAGAGGLIQYSGVVTAENCYSILRVLKADGTLEKPATPLYGDVGDESGTVRYLSSAAAAGSFGTAFEAKGDEDTHVYDLRRRLNSSVEKLEPPYPFPGLEDLPHYGDWAELEEETLLAAGLAYYEVYQEDGGDAYGAEGFFENGDPLTGTLREAAENPVVTRDGYALVFQGDAPAEKFTVNYGSDSAVRWTLEELTWKRGVGATAPSQTVESFQMTLDGKTCTLIPLPDEIVTQAWAGIKASSKFYQKLDAAPEGAATEEEGLRTYWLNPHFAETVRASTPAEPDFMGKYPVSVRTPRHLYNLSAMMQGSTQFYARKMGWHYEQNLDLDYSTYEWYGSTQPTVSGSVCMQNPIGMNALSSQFQSVYDGYSHSIRNVFYNSSASNTHLGLFGYVANGAVLKNIVYELDPSRPLTVNAGNSKARNGVLVGEVNGKLENCAAYGVNVQMTGGESVGGLVGRIAATGNVEKCSVELVSLETTGGTYIGGLVGQIDNGRTVSESYAVGKITSTSNTQLSGLAGYNLGTVVNCYAAVNLVTAGPQNVLCRGGGNGTATNSYWLTGMFRYRGKTYDASSYIGQGSALFAGDLAEKLTTLSPNPRTVTGPIPDEEWKTDYEGQGFPYVSGVEADGAAVHYGLWPVAIESSPEVSLFYFEQYKVSGTSPASYGVYRNIREAGAEEAELDTVTGTEGKTVVTDGYAVAVKSSDWGKLDAISHIEVQYGERTYRFQKADSGGTVLSWTGGVSEASLSFTPKDSSGASLGYVLLALPWAVHKDALADPGSFYQTLTVTPRKADGEAVETGIRTFYFNPHFAKALSCPAEGTTERPVLPDEERAPILVRTARHFHDISRFQSSYVWGKEYFFLQERDLDYGEFTGYATGGATGTPFIQGNPYRQTPIGYGPGKDPDSTAFRGVYDGQYHAIKNVAPISSEEYFQMETMTGLFYYSAGTLRKMNYTPGGPSASGLENAMRHSGKTVYAGGLAARNGGSIENCTVLDVSFQSGTPVLGNVKNMDFYAGGLVGHNTGTIVNCAVKMKGTQLAFNPRQLPGSSAEDVSCTVGGLVGRNEGKVDRCAAVLEKCEALSSADRDDETFFACYLFAGLVGANEENCEILSSYAVGEIALRSADGSCHLCGFAGKNFGTIKECYEAVGLRSEGGSYENYGWDFCYWFEKGIIQDCYFLYDTWTYGGREYTARGSTLSGVTPVTCDELKNLELRDADGKLVMGRIPGTDKYPFPTGVTRPGATGSESSYYIPGADWPRKTGTRTRRKREPEART